ncbi:phosphoribosylaminoimidazolesuccinocarboxamide synthase [Salinarchaeum sp. IM2453]|uniref:phosphoribosylaminoimidazolesuccinocarboxamide synthase n=1 Tax=Salinarchaeum sp. IM2453 TaxID=2862870 RepID=UPI001C82DDA8|nr:phosphoribosylaminoimidazolesuccinocarboxamide synthase [Salinarchaeum sp. IM2453]QZA88108.1 phosphoribosylaminoimidazolesuccinocarboxamide synthase [Salinarchaeum sp. IM2453]
MTSVKEFVIDIPAESDALGSGSFLFTDAYSIFDWGQMPDPIPDKGASLCVMGGYNFELLEKNGVSTHYKGVVPDGQSDPVSIDKITEPPTEMAIELTQVPDLPYTGNGYDYTSYHDEAGENYLVPLEIVFRNRVPIGSSLRRRTDPADHGLSYDNWPESQVELDDPIVEFSTKYEESDRYLSQDEANDIAGHADIDALVSLAQQVNEIITEHANQQGFTHEDGKIEVFYHSGELKVADVVGTFDENRFTYDGQQLSKEVLRQYHRETQSDWVTAVKEAKRRAKSTDTADWRTICDQSPEPLDNKVIQIVRDMYASGANAYIDQQLFDAPEIDSTIDEIKKLVEL